VDRCLEQLRGVYGRLPAMYAHPAIARYLDALESLPALPATSPFASNDTAASFLAGAHFAMLSPGGGAGTSTRNLTAATSPVGGVTTAPPPVAGPTPAAAPDVRAFLCDPTTIRVVAADVATPAATAKRVASLAGNEVCGECGAPDNTWASVNLGVLLCLRCSGAHRQLGVHISQVRSVGLDQWKPVWLHRVLAIGNRRSNAFWERRYTAGAQGTHPRPNASTPLPQVYAWMRSKYEHRTWAAPGVTPGDLFDIAASATPEGAALRKALAGGPAGAPSGTPTSKPGGGAAGATDFDPFGMSAGAGPLPPVTGSGTAPPPLPPRRAARAASGSAAVEPFPAASAAATTSVPASEFEFFGSDQAPSLESLPLPTPAGTAVHSAGEFDFPPAHAPAIPVASSADFDFPDSPPAPVVAAESHSGEFDFVTPADGGVSPLAPTAPITVAVPPTPPSLAGAPGTSSALSSGTAGDEGDDEEDDDGREEAAAARRIVSLRASLARAVSHRISLDGSPARPARTSSSSSRHEVAFGDSRPSSTATVGTTTSPPLTALPEGTFDWASARDDAVPASGVDIDVWRLVGGRASVLADGPLAPAPAVGAGGGRLATWDDGWTGGGGSSSSTADAWDGTTTALPATAAAAGSAASMLAPAAGGGGAAGAVELPDGPSLSFPPEVTIPWEHIVLGKRIGAGGFAVVYRGMYEGRHVAVKQLIRQPGEAPASGEGSDGAVPSADVRAQEDFVRETSLMVQLRHPNVVCLIGAVPHPLSLVTELCERGNLFDLLHAKGLPLPWGRRLRMALGVSRGMAYLHAKGVIHRVRVHAQPLHHTRMNGCPPLTISPCPRRT